VSRTSPGCFSRSGYRRDHLRALAQRVEVADREVRIIGSKSNLRQTLTAASGVKSATPGVRSCDLGSGGEGGIRTPDTVARMPHFECGAIDHSATSPDCRYNLGFRFLPECRRSRSQLARATRMPDAGSVGPNRLQGRGGARAGLLIHRSPLRALAATHPCCSRQHREGRPRDRHGIYPFDFVEAFILGRSGPAPCGRPMRGQPSKTAAAFLHRFSAQRLLQSVNARLKFAGWK
jgi:hypothetical protein